jgi:predicted DNA-binding transcriptional regulator YafY
VTSFVIFERFIENIFMRAGRLVTLMLILARRGRVTAAQLADELEVSTRTVLRDIEELSGAGVPIYATRGQGGGFQLIEGYTPEVAGPAHKPLRDRRPGRPKRAGVRISPEGRRRAAVLGALQPLRVRRAVPPDERGWLEATFRIDSFEGAVIDVLSLGPHIVVLEPARFRNEVADRIRRAALLYPEEPGRS